MIGASVTQAEWPIPTADGTTWRYAFTREGETEPGTLTRQVFAPKNPEEQNILRIETAINGIAHSTEFLKNESNAILATAYRVQGGKTEAFDPAITILPADLNLGTEWNYHGPRWRGRPEVKQIREEDTDWRKWLLDKPYRPFDPRAYFEFRLYHEFSSGIPDQWMSHGIDMVHHLMDDYFPKSAVAHGGVYSWPDGRETADTFHALLEYPKGFLVSYSTSFGNDSDSSTRIMGKKATLINIGGEGSRRWKLVEDKGTHESNPFIRRPERLLKLADDKLRSMPLTQRLMTGAIEKTYGPLPFTSDKNPTHMKNWFECMRSRKQPNATVEHGFAQSVAVIMAARAQREGKKLYWDAATETIVDTPPNV